VWGWGDVGPRGGVNGTKERERARERQGRVCFIFLCNEGCGADFFGLLVF
jgi:hypothetical protein